MKKLDSVYRLLGVSSAEALESTVVSTFSEIVVNSTWCSVSAIAGRKPEDSMISSISNSLYHLLFPDPITGKCSENTLPGGLFQIEEPISPLEFSKRFSYDFLLENLYDDPVLDSVKWIECAQISMLLHYKTCYAYDILFDMKYIKEFTNRIGPEWLRPHPPLRLDSLISLLISSFVEISEY